MVIPLHTIGGCHLDFLNVAENTGSAPDLFHQFSLLRCISVNAAQNFDVAMQSEQVGGRMASWTSSMPLLLAWMLKVIDTFRSLGSQGKRRGAFHNRHPKIRQWETDYNVGM